MMSVLARRKWRGLLSLLAIFAAIPVNAVERDKVELRYRSYRNWKIQLPAEQWFPVGTGIELKHSGGSKFPVRIDGNNLEFDSDGDGEFDRSVKALVDPKTNVSTTRVILSGKTVAGEEFKYAVRLRNDANGWEWAPGGAMAGTLHSESGPIPVRLIDQNGNGRFDDVGADAMIVGSSDHAVLLSSTVFVDDKLARVNYLDEGKAIQLEEYEGQTAEIDMTSEFKSSAVLLSSVIVSEDGQHSFDVGAIQGGVTVPAGTYSIAAGQIGLGRQRVFINPGKSKPIELAAGDSKEFKWGGPIRSEFRFDRSGNQVTFSPESIWYFGNAGEQYVGWTPAGKSPEFKITDADTGVVIDVAILPGSC